jgi:tetratricopeptide (TPR) repeat protein
LLSRNLDTFVRGLAALERGDRAAAAEALAKMKAEAPVDAGSSGHSHGAMDPYLSGWRETDAVLRKELEARILFAEGKTEPALRAAREAAVLEDATSFEFGPPDIVKPSHELMGELLLAANRPAEARQEFEKALSRAPNRTPSLLGLARAASRAGDAAAAQKAYGKLREVWSRADPDVAGLAEARRTRGQS